MPTTTVTIRVPAELRERLDALAEATERSRSWLAQRALESYVERERWQVDKVRAGLAAAAAGDFVEQDAVEALRDRWAPPAPRPT